MHGRSLWNDAVIAGWACGRRFVGGQASHRVKAAIAWRALPLIATVVLAGCGDYRPERVPVSGRVVIDGQPLEHGFVRFIAAKDRPSVAELGPDGRFELTCFTQKDGSVLGQHVVTVTAAESVSPQEQKWHAPKRYADPATSDLSVTIDGPTKDLLLELTWGGGAPFVERFVGE